MPDRADNAEWDVKFFCTMSSKTFFMFVTLLCLLLMKLNSRNLNLNSKTMNGKLNDI